MVPAWVFSRTHGIFFSENIKQVNQVIYKTKYTLGLMSLYAALFVYDMVCALKWFSLEWRIDINVTTVNISCFRLKKSARRFGGLRRRGDPKKELVTPAQNSLNAMTSTRMRYVYLWRTQASFQPLEPASRTTRIPSIRSGTFWIGVTCQSRLNSLLGGLHD